MLNFSVTRMTMVFRVSRSRFYYWVENRHKLDTKVKETFDVSKERDGSDVLRKNWLRAVVTIMLRALPLV